MRIRWSQIAVHEIAGGGFCWILSTTITVPSLLSILCSRQHFSQSQYHSIVWNSRATGTGNSLPLREWNDAAQPGLAHLDSIARPCLEAAPRFCCEQEDGDHCRPASAMAVDNGPMLSGGHGVGCHLALRSSSPFQQLWILGGSHGLFEDGVFWRLRRRGPQRPTGSCIRAAGSRRIADEASASRELFAAPRFGRMLWFRPLWRDLASRLRPVWHRIRPTRKAAASWPHHAQPRRTSLAV